MSLEIVAYRAKHVQVVKDLNGRLRAGGVTLFQFPESPVSWRLPKIEGRETYEEYFLACEHGCVRGGYILKHQPFWIGGRPRSVGYLQLPLSEGIVNKAHGRVGVQLFADALRKAPLLYGLGMGSMGARYVQIMVALRSKARPVPFYFRVVNAARFFREIAHLRTTTPRKRLLDALARSGAGGAALRIAQAVPSRLFARHDHEVEVVRQFGDWCDGLWDRCRSEYAMAAVRDRATLAVVYPGSDRFIRLKVSRAGVPIGWAVVLATQMSGHKYFGDMKVGTIVDCLAARDDARPTIAAATGYLEQAGADVIVSNQSASSWRRAFRRSGYLRGPSNFIFAPSKALGSLLDGVGATFDRIHLTRGDGEGPSTL